MNKLIVLIAVVMAMLTFSGCSRNKFDYEQTLLPAKTGTPMPTPSNYEKTRAIGFIEISYTQNPLQFPSSARWFYTRGGVYLFGEFSYFDINSGKIDIRPYRLIVFFPQFAAGRFPLGYLVYDDGWVYYADPQYKLIECIYYQPCVGIYRYAEVGISDSEVDYALCKKIVNGEIEINYVGVMPKGKFDFICITETDVEVHIQAEFQTNMNP